MYTVNAVYHYASHTVAVLNKDDSEVLNDVIRLNADIVTELYVNALESTDPGIPSKSKDSSGHAIMRWLEQPAQSKIKNRIIAKSMASLQVREVRAAHARHSYFTRIVRLWPLH